MARITVISRTCDMCGGPDASPYPLSAVREIDLCDNDRQTMLNVLAPYIEKSRPIRRGGAAPRPKQAPWVRSLDPAKVRQWAHDQGLEVGPRGRLSDALMEQYRAAHA